MKLEQRVSGCKEYRCNLTKELDKISGISKQYYYDMFHHYILADEWCRNESVLLLECQEVQ